MNEPSIDFSPLDPARDQSRLESALADIHRDTLDALAARVAAAAPDERGGFGASIAALSLPALVGAGFVLVISLSTLAVRDRHVARTAYGASTPDVLGIPARLTALMRTPGTVSLADLNDALGGDQ